MNSCPNTTQPPILHAILSYCYILFEFFVFFFCDFLAFTFSIFFKILYKIVYSNWICKMGSGFTQAQCDPLLNLLKNHNRIEEEHKVNYVEIWYEDQRKLVSSLSGIVDTKIDQQLSFERNWKHRDIKFKEHWSRH